MRKRQGPNDFLGGQNLPAAFFSVKAEAEAGRKVEDTATRRISTMLR